MLKAMSAFNTTLHGCHQPHKEGKKMQKIAEETKVISANLTMEQYQWLLTKAEGRRLSAFIRELIDQAMRSDHEKR